MCDYLYLVKPYYLGEKLIRKCLHRDLIDRCESWDSQPNQSSTLYTLGLRRLIGFIPEKVSYSSVENAS